MNWWYSRGRTELGVPDADSYIQTNIFKFRGLYLPLWPKRAIPQPTLWDNPWSVQGWRNRSWHPDTRESTAKQDISLKICIWSVSGWTNWWSSSGRIEQAVPDADSYFLASPGANICKFRGFIFKPLWPIQAIPHPTLWDNSFSLSMP